MATGGETTVIRGSRLKSALAVLASAGFVAISVWMLTSHLAPGKNPPVLLAWTGLIFFGVCGLIGAFRLVRPSYLILAPEGFILETPPFPARTCLWADIDQIYIWQMSSTRGVAFTYVEGRQPTDALTTINAGLGAPGTIGAHWQIGPDKLLELAVGYHRVAVPHRYAPHSAES